MRTTTTNQQGSETAAPGTTLGRDRPHRGVCGARPRNRYCGATAKPQPRRAAALTLAWGGQVDIRPILRTADVEDVELGQISEQRLSGYIAKYATKGTGKTEAADRPIRSQLDIDHLRISDHHRRVIETAWDLGGHELYADPNLRRWAHMLGFRGHFLTKSRAYSTTFKTLRGDRQAHRLTERLTALGIPADDFADITVITTGNSPASATPTTQNKNSPPPSPTAPDKHASTGIDKNRTK